MTSVNELKNRTASLPPADTNVQLPAAIRAAAARSNALHKQAYETAPDAAAKPEAAAATPEAGGTEGKSASAQPEAVTTPETGTEGAASQTPAQGADNWEHKYNSMKGRYERQEDTIKGLNSRISQLEALLSRAQAQPPAQQLTPDLSFKKITEKDREDFGTDFIDVAQRAAEEKLSPEIAELKAKLARLEGNLNTTVEQTQQTRQQAMWAFLTEKLPNWRTINRDAKFLAWTNLPDPLSGGIRGDMLRDAYAQGDAQRVLRFFHSFLTDEAATAPAADTKPDANKGKVPLETFAAPGRATAPATTVVPGEKETITNAQIAQFYLDVQKGKYRGNPAEKDRLERMIFDAQAEGRIV